MVKEGQLELGLSRQYNLVIFLSFPPRPHYYKREMVVAGSGAAIENCCILVLDEFLLVMILLTPRLDSW